MSFTPPKEDFSDADLKVTAPHTWAVGLPAIEHAMLPELGDLGPERTAEVTFSINHKKGFDCPSCAWANPDHSKPLEFCENGAKSVVWESTPTIIPDEFWAQHSLTDLAGMSEYWLGLQGRITKPMYKAADSDHYVPLDWDAALDLRPRSSRASRTPTRQRSTPPAASRTSPRSCSNSSPAPSAPTTCLTAPTCATRPRAPV